MKTGHLKTVRVVLSLGFFGLTALVFLDLASVIPPWFTGGILYLQFIPDRKSVV